MSTLCHVLCVVLVLLLASPADTAAAGPYDAEFRAYLENIVIPEARAAGVSAALLERELEGLTLDTSLPGLTKPGGGGVPKVDFQAEFRAPARYFRDSQFQALAARGRALSASHKRTLAAIERRYGVPGRIILAIWGRESGYGAAKIPYDAIRVLATQAFMGQRADFYRGELIAALKILQAGDVPRARLKSSWGGAMGQPQFLPSSYLKYAVDFDGDGRRDIWGSAADTLASIAHYLREHGWVPGRDWGYEVVVPASLSCVREGPDRGQPITEWEKEGVRRVRDRPFPDHERRQPGFLLMPAGRYGPAFLVTENFYVLKAYNESDVYALFVGHLADRYGGARGFVGNWAPLKTTTRGRVRDLQVDLQRRGHDVGGADGLIGFKTRRSMGAAQENAGRTPTCWLE